MVIFPVRMGCLHLLAAVHTTKWTFKRHFLNCIASQVLVATSVLEGDQNKSKHQKHSGLMSLAVTKSVYCCWCGNKGCVLRKSRLNLFHLHKINFDHVEGLVWDHLSKLL